jgi:uracil-DNA glycosylase
MPNPSRVPLTPYQEFKQHYAKGCGSDICHRARNICLMRGTVPSEIIFIGEGPGLVEDSIGLPFTGPAGQLLNSIVDNSVGIYNQQRKAKGEPPLATCFTNLVGCIPLEDDGTKGGQPSHEDIQSCRPRLEEFLELANPELVVCVGKLANQYLRQGYRDSIALPDKETPVIEITHPSWALRKDSMTRFSYERRTAVIIMTELRAIWGD